MKIADILSLSNTLHNAVADTKKGVLSIIAQLVSDSLPDISERQVLESLSAREKLGSTGIGYGVAIPHCQLENLSRPIAVFIHLQKPIDFASIDDQPADLFFALVVPEDSKEQLEVLSLISAKLNNQSLRDKLRQAKTKEELYQLLISN